jgi:hypothetical protein
VVFDIEISQEEEHFEVIVPTSKTLKPTLMLLDYNLVEGILLRGLSTSHVYRVESGTHRI